MYINGPGHMTKMAADVLSDHFSNSLSEKATNDIPMKFSQCHFKTTFYRLPLPNRGIYLKSLM